MRKRFGKYMAVSMAAFLLSAGTLSYLPASAVYAAETVERTQSSIQTGVYVVPVRLMQATDLHKPSMAADCIADYAVLKVKEDGSMSMEVTLKTLQMYNLYGNATDVKLYSSYNSYASSKKINASVLSTRKAETGPVAALKEVTVPERVSFSLPYTDKEGIFLTMSVDAMGGIYTDAFLSIDFGKAVPAGDLAELIQKAEGVDKEKFASSSYAALESACNAARKVMTASDVTEETLKAAKQRLQSALNALVLKDGTYKVPVTIYKSNADEASIMAAGINPIADVVVKNGKVQMDLKFGPVSHFGVGGYISKVSTLVDIVFNENNIPSKFSKVDAAVLSTYDVVDEYNKQDSVLTETAGVKYPEKVQIKTDASKFTWLNLYVPAMAGFGRGDQMVRLCTDYLNAEKVEAEAVKPTIKLNVTKATITAGKTAALKATVSGTNVSNVVTFTSSDTKTAKVGKTTGVVTGVKAGTAVITATANGVSAKCTITVKAAPAISLNKKTAVIYTKGNKTFQLKAMVTGSSKAVTYTSSNKKAAIVDKNGKVKAVGVGKTTITAKANGVTAACVVTVKKPSLTVKKSRLMVKKNKTVTIKAVAAPSGKITYTSLDKSIATVTSKGMVKGRRAGVVKIKVKCNGVTKNVTVTVK